MQITDTILDIEGDKDQTQGIMLTTMQEQLRAQPLEGLLGELPRLACLGN